MLVVKRFLAFAINYLFLLLTFEIINFFQNDNNNQELRFNIIVSSFFCIIIPILIYNRTLGYIILNLKYVNNGLLKIKLTIKYLFILSITLIPFFESIVNLLNNVIFYNLVSNTFNLQLSNIIAVIFIILLSFIVSKGKYTFIDYALNLQISNYKYITSKNSLMRYFFLYIATFITTNAILYKYMPNERMSEFAFTTESYSLEKYFPKEIFERYCKSITTFNEHSTFLNKNEKITYINQTIPINVVYVDLNKNTFSSFSLMEEFCNEILYYCSLTSTRNQVYMTKFIFQYYESHLFFDKIYKYNFYYDNYINDKIIYGIKIDTIKNIWDSYGDTISYERWISLNNFIVSNNENIFLPLNKMKPTIELHFDFMPNDNNSYSKRQVVWNQPIISQNIFATFDTFLKKESR